MSMARNETVFRRNHSINRLKYNEIIYSQHVFHLHRLTDTAVADHEGSVFEFGRSHANFGITRETKTFARNENAKVHFVIFIFIMNDGNRISSGRDITEGDIAPARQNELFHRGGIFGAIGERSRIFGQTHHKLPLCVAQIGDAYIYVNARRR